MNGTAFVVVTDLANHVMPFINYSAGDLAVAGERCPCGRGMPTLARLDGVLLAVAPATAWVVSRRWSSWPS